MTRRNEIDAIQINGAKMTRNFSCQKHLLFSLLLCFFLVVQIGCKKTTDAKKVSEENPATSVAKNDEKSPENSSTKKPDSSDGETAAADDTNPGKSTSPNSDPKENETYWDSVTKLYEKAKSSGATSAKNAKEWAADMLGAAKDKSSEISQSTSKWVEEMYESAKNGGTTQAKNSKEWVQDEFAKMGTWEYEVVSVFDAKDEKEKLNEMGGERWECFNVVSKEGETRFFFKRPVKSQFEHIPVKELIRLLPFLL